MFREGLLNSTYISIIKELYLFYITDQSSSTIGERTIRRGLAWHFAFLYV